METLDHAIAELAQAQYGVFSRRQAVGMGATPSMIQHRLNVGAWQPRHRGVYGLAGVPASWEGDQMSACLWSGGVTGVRAAAHLHGLPGFERPPVEVVTLSGARPMPCCGITVHHTKWLPPTQVVRVRNIPCSSIDRTLLDLCGHVGPRRSAIAVDHALHGGMTTIGSLDHCLYLTARRGRDGCAILRRLVKERWDMREFPNSPLETVIFEMLVAAELHRPVLQLSIYDRAGFVARPDFVWPEQRLVVEGHSKLWHESVAVQKKDRQKCERLASLGYRTLYVTWADATTFRTRTIQAIERALRQQRRDLMSKNYAGASLS